MTSRDRILDAAQELLLSGESPTLEAVARAAGVSKGGLLYHFDKQGMLEAIVERAITQFDARLTEAVARGDVAATWLRLSVPSGRDRELYRALASAFRVMSHSGTDEVRQRVPTLAVAERRWAELLEAELGDPVAAQVVTLVADGLLWTALTNPTHADATNVEALLDHLGLNR